LAVFPLSASASSDVFAYAPNENNSTISQFQVGSGGVLTPLSPPSLPTVSYVTGYQNGAAISADGGSLYMPDFTGIEQYTIGSDGTLTPKSTPWIPSGTLLDCGCTSEGTAVAQAVAVSPNGKYVYVGNDDGPGDISEYSVGADGSLSPLSGTDNFTTGIDDTIGLTISANGKYLYSNNPGEIVQMKIARNGQLSYNPAGSTAGVYFDGLTGSVVLSPNGRSAYVPAFNTIQEMTVSGKGTLSPAGPGYVTFTSGGGTHEGIAMSSDGRILWATDPVNNTITRLVVAADGTVTPTKFVLPTTGTGPDSITVSSDGTTVYVMNGSGGSAISVYSVGAHDQLTPEASPTIPNEFPVTLVLAP
jgi:DNA-binding beta-propeller fold protein YncE